MPQRQQMQVMIAQQALRSVTKGHQAAQHAQRVWPPVNQITQQVKRIAAGRKINFFEQPLKWCIATLQVADKVE